MKLLKKDREIDTKRMNNNNNNVLIPSESDKKFLYENIF